MVAAEIIHSLFCRLDGTVPGEMAERFYRISRLEPIRAMLLRHENKAEDIQRRIAGRVKREACLAVLRELSCRCGNHFLAVKGVGYAVDLYPDPELRTYGDIDIITRPEFAGDVFDALRNIGFSAPYARDACMDQLKQEHVVLKTAGKLYPVEVELHAAAWNPVAICPEYIDLMMERAVWCPEAGAWLPDPADRVIHSLMHFWIHLRDYLLEAYIADETIPLNLRDLLDVALTEEKYNNIVTPEILAERVKQIGAERDIAGALHVYRILFPASAIGRAGIGRTGHSIVFADCGFLEERLYGISSVNDLFGSGLKKLIGLEPKEAFGRAVCDGRLKAPGIMAAVSKKENYIYADAVLHTEPAPAVNTRLKIYYLTSAEDSFAIRMVTFRLREDGIEIDSNGNPKAPEVLYWKQTAMHAWQIGVRFPADDVWLSDGIVYMDPVLEYGVITQRCIFGSRWNELARWQPICVNSTALPETDLRLCGNR